MPSTFCESGRFMNRVGSRLTVEWLGRVAYSAGLELQTKALEARRNRVAGDRLLLLEHPPVITLGRSAREANLLLSREVLADKRIDVHEVPRGGDVTYHAPGQLVGYLVVDLKARGEADVHSFLRRIEEALIESLEGFGLRARSVPGRTGVFIATDAVGAKTPSRKIASIGVGLQHWITFHGFALNVTLDLAGFDAIVPCGLADVKMTSVARELERGALGLDAEVRERVGETFSRAFA